MSAPPVVLSVAGTDSGGAAGLAADLTTFAALGVHGACAVTAVTAQDTTGVHGVVTLEADAVRAQMRAVLDDLPVAAAKTGMLGSAAVVQVVAESLAGVVPLVVDPVLVATSGAVLGDEAVVTAYRDLLLPHVEVVTPNRDEAATLTGLPVATDAVELAAAVHAFGPAVVLTGGGPGTGYGPEPGTEMRNEPGVGLAGNDPADQPRGGSNRGSSRGSNRGSSRGPSGGPGGGPGGGPSSWTGADRCRDVVVTRGTTTVLEHRAVPTHNDHGTGCTFSAALAAYLAHGLDVVAAAGHAQTFVARQLRAGATWRLGRGRGPLAHVNDQPPNRRPDIRPDPSHDRPTRPTH